MEGTSITFTTEFINLYFAGKPVYRVQGSTTHSPLVTDRVGSMVHNGVRPQSYYPYGEEKSTITGSNQDRFATYYRDAFTNFDYAIERYYHSGSGRFLTPDPYRASAGPADPGSWNRYAYVQGDPVNFNDPSGLYMAWWDDGWGGGGGSPWCAWETMMGYSGGPACWTQAFDPILRFDRGELTGGGGGKISTLAAARSALQSVSPALRRAVAIQDIFTASQLDCISGIETGRTWDPNIVAANGRVGLFQFDEANWLASGTSIPWEDGQPAKDPEIAATVTLAFLHRKLGYVGVNNPTAAAITTAIDNFGEGDGRYGQAVMDCAKELDAGKFQNANAILVDYANWVAQGRP